MSRKEKDSKRLPSIKRICYSIKVVRRSYLGQMFYLRKTIHPGRFSLSKSYSFNFPREDNQPVAPGLFCLIYAKNKNFHRWSLQGKSGARRLRFYHQNPGQRQGIKRIGKEYHQQHHGTHCGSRCPETTEGTQRGGADL